MQKINSTLVRDFAESASNFERRARALKDPAANHAQIEPAPADDDRKAPARGDTRDCLPRQLRKLSHVQRLIGIAHVYKMMRRAAPILARRLGGADIHPAIKLPRVGIDDLNR